MTDLIPAAIVLFVVGLLLWAAIRNIQDSLHKREAEYWQQECALLQYENQFFRNLEQRLVPRLLSRFGADFQDFMIEREIGHSDDSGAIEPVRRKPFVIYRNGDSRAGYDITANRIVPTDGSNGEDDDEPKDEYTARGERIYAQHQRTARTIRQHSPVFAPKQPLRAAISTNRHILFVERQYGDTDVIDAEYTKIPKLPFRQPENQVMGTVSFSKTQPTPTPRKGGRPKKYATAAERQAAYRARRAA